MTEENEKNCMKKLSCKNNPGLLGYKEYTAVSIAGNYPRPPPRRKDRCACTKSPEWKFISTTCTVLCILLIILQRLGFFDMLLEAMLLDE